MLIDTAYRKYSGPMLQAMIRFSRDETAANDAVSQAFTQALVNRAMLEAMPEPAMKAWLYAAARNALVDMKRKEARLVSLEGSSPAEIPFNDPSDRILAESMLSRLPPGLRAPVYLKYYRGFNSAEIGQAMHSPASTARTRLRTALGLMRAMMKGD